MGVDAFCSFCATAVSCINKTNVTVGLCVCRLFDFWCHLFSDWNFESTQEMAH